MTAHGLLALILLGGTALAVAAWAWNGYAAVGVALWLAGLPLC